MAFFPELQYNAPKINTPFENALPVAQLQQAANQNKLSQMQFQKAERDQAQENMLAGAYRDSYGADGKQDRNKLYGAVAAGGGGHLLPGIQKGYNEADASGVKLENDRMDGRKKQVESTLQILTATEQLMRGVQDQASYDAVLPQLRALHGPETAAKIPAVYDPVAIARGREQAMPLKEKLAQEWKELDFGLKSANEPFKADGSPNTAVQNYGIQKATAGAQQGYTAPVAGMQNGKPVFFQPSKGGGTPSIVPGIEPPPKTVNEKSLPSTAIKSLTGAGQAVEDTNRLTNTFKDGYGGKTILGNLSNTIGRLAGDDTGQAQWWQDMDQLQNQTRHELFGSALTKTELTAWEKTSVTPRMEAGEIKKNLQRRQEIEARAASKLARGYAAAGYSKDQINELLGTAAEYLDKPAPPAGNAAPPSSPKAASAYLSGAKDKADFTARVRALKAKGWTEKQISAANGE